MEDFNLFDKIDAMTEQDKEKLTGDKSNKSKTNTRGRKFKEEVLKFPIKEDDPELVIFTKELINRSNVTNKQVYDEFGSSLGYNLIYSLIKPNKPAISWDRVRIWADFLGYDINLSFNKKVETIPTGEEK